jgi:Flp pilus assembly protein TadB
VISVLVVTDNQSLRLSRTAAARTRAEAPLDIAPSSHHRLLWRQGAKEATLRAANRLSVVGLAFLALAMVGAIFLITDVLFGGVVAAVATVAIGAVFAWVWYGQPLLRLRD